MKKRDILIAILLSIPAAAAAAYWSPGEFGIGFRGTLLLALPCFLLMAAAWNWGGRGKLLAAMMLLAFGLRLGGGLAVQNLLPVYGHPGNEAEEAGLLFNDAYRRDGEAWAAAHKENLSFFDILKRKNHNDQYGAMAVLGIMNYQYLSGDAHRFVNLILIGAFFTACGLPFLWKAVNDRWGRRPALIACWIYTLYPDSIFYSASPMREAFLIGLTAVGFWALCTLREHFKKSLAVFGAVILMSVPFSHFIAETLVGVAALWIWAEFLIPASKKWLTGGIILMVFCILAAVVIGLPSFEEWIHYDIHTTENGSGWVEKVVGEIGGQFRSAFVAVYGITQPVLPAILAYPVAPACTLNVDKCTTLFWKGAGIFRAFGWYLMVPFLFYALFTTVREKDKKEKTLLIVNALFVLAWIFIASLRAGGDQWDNPRYRVIFLPWLAFFCAWGIDRAIREKDFWLARWIAIEVIFLFFFTQWYISRYSGNAIRRFPFWKTVIYIVAGSAVVFATGFVEKIAGKKSRKTEKRSESEE